MKEWTTGVWIVLAALALGQTEARADVFAEAPDCALFAADDLGGAYLTAKAVDKDPFLASLPVSWQNQVSSVYVRQGFVLELYSETYFMGKLVSIAPGLNAVTAAPNGASVNLRDVSFDKQVASYRCRAATSKITTPIGDAPWIEGAYYYWYSGGNHYDQKWLRMETIDGHAVIKAHSDDTYSINVQDYEIDLTEGTVKIQFKAYGGVAGSTEFTLKMASARNDFHNMLTEFVETLKVISQGYFRPHADRLAPPAPELIELATFFTTL